MLGDRMLPLVIAVNVFLACMAVLGAVAATGVTTRWSSEVERLVTVQVAPHLGDAADANLKALMEMLRDDPGVAKAHALELEELQTLLAPWLGQNNAIGELPIPRVVDIELKADADVGMLRARLERKFPGVTVDDHQDWHSKTQQVGWYVRLGATAVIGLITLAGVAVIIFATRASLREHSRLVALLHLIGATDGYTAGEFQKHFLGIGIVGALLGGIPLAACLAGLHYYDAGQTSMWLVGALPQSSLDYIPLALPPVAAAVLTMFTARLTVLRALKRMN